MDPTFQPSRAAAPVLSVSGIGKTYAEPVLADVTLTEPSLGNLYDEFFRRYESIYGKGSSFRGAGIEAVTFRVRASAATPKLARKSTTHAPTTRRPGILTKEPRKP